MTANRAAQRLRALLSGCVLWLMAAVAWAAPGALDNAGCLRCHQAGAEAIKVAAADGKSRPLLAMPADRYSQSVHGKMACVACHEGITDNPPAGSQHQRLAGRPTNTVGCADCHQKLWNDTKAAGTTAARPGLGVVAENIDAYRKSYHARANKDDKSKVNATCDNCHDTHSFNIPPKDSPAHAQWRLDSSALCGDNCHSDELDDYTSSVHGKEAIDKRNTKSAVCADCHSAHSVGNTSAAPIKLAITASCGNCHLDEYKSYKGTYHGQINTLGYAHTAKCFDCHGSHGIRKADDPKSKVHANNRLKTCQSCHSGKKDLALASAGFVSFQPHGRTDDFARYPQMWLSQKLMVGLLLGTFGFFWAHTALWFWRELQDRRQALARPHVRAEAVPKTTAAAQHIRRFSAGWRAAHLVFALALMLLTLTGMPLFYPDAAWAPVLMNALGGPKVAGLVHRSAAVVFGVIFFGHVIVLAINVWRRRKTFRWLGPDSLIPNLQDLKDIVAMFRWFMGKGPRPVFDRWTYWEKFDYWAPFWGITIIGVSGLVMWLPTVFGAVLPGWVFNVAAIFHGEEAFLAVVFLFTVHFFNNHFRPDKFPLETVMFSGSMDLEHFKREHALQYQRLVDSGELAQHLVSAPSAPMRLWHRVLGFTLIAFGLVLLAGVAVGFFGG